jgi:hypothetical protein
MAATTWTDEMKADVVERYLAADPTPSNSMEIVKEIQEALGLDSPNGVRMILSKARKADGSEVYVKKDAKAAPASKTAAASGDKAPRISKDAAHSALTKAIEESGAEVDTEIVSKLTGKAAMYFAGVLAAANGGDQNDED